MSEAADAAESPERRLLRAGNQARASESSEMRRWMREIEQQLKELRQTLAVSDFVPYPAPRMPRREDFDSDEAYEEAYRDWQVLEATWRENHKDVRIDGGKP